MNTSSKWVLLSFAVGTGWGREVQEAAPRCLEGRRTPVIWGDTWPPDSFLILSALPRRGVWDQLFIIILLMFYRQRHLPLQGRLPVSFWQCLGRPRKQLCGHCLTVGAQRTPLCTQLESCGGLPLSWSWEERGVWSSVSGWVGVGRQWDGNQQFDKQIITKPPWV